MSDGPRSSGATKRPVYLVIALIAMFLFGMNEVLVGYATIGVIHDPLSVAPSASAVGNEIVARAFVDAIAHHPRENLPIGIAQVLLGGALLLVSLKALIARRASAAFAVQVLIANAALLVAGYVLQQPVRSTIIERVVASGLPLPPKGIGAAEFANVMRTELWWVFRIKLAVELGMIALCAFALTRRAARQVLAPAEPHPEEP